MDRNTSWGIVILLFLLLFGWQYYQQSTSIRQISYTTFINQLKKENIQKVTVQGDKLEGRLKQPVEAKADKDGPGSEYSHFVTYLPSFGDQNLLNTLEDKGVDIQTRPEPESSTWESIILLLPFLFLFFILFVQYKRMQGQGGGLFSIGKSQARLYDRSQEKTTFEDVAGAEGPKTELQEVVSYLKEPERIRSLGGKVPKGIMLVGPPGTGKTLLARAVAGEADAPFFSITGSDFMEMFVGVGAKRVRNLFEEAKKNAPSIIFIDEIDSIGRRRGAGLGGGHDEREQTLNQLLAELDGFEETQDVIVMCATNRPDILDQALLRPGRFDRRIIVDLPNTKDRKEILSVYGQNKKFDPDVDLDRLARGTPGFSGADLENLLNEAAILAARREMNSINNQIIEEARDKILMGLVREGLSMSEEEKKIVAYHEAGHAIVGASMKKADPIHKVSIVPRTQSMGVTQQLPEEEKYIYERDYLLDRLAVIMGGRAAEVLVFSTATSGAGNDLQQATQMARQMVLEWGMSGRFEHMALGGRKEQIFLGEELGRPREYSENTAREVDQEVESLLDKAYTRAEKVLSQRRQILDRLAEKLLHEEEIPGEEVYSLLKEKDRQT
ncbi:MAG: ATP-dependent zinc metalloprotease FtsH [Desulfonatronovibrionaceae bacterium]